MLRSVRSGGLGVIGLGLGVGCAGSELEGMRLTDGRRGPALYSSETFYKYRAAHLSISEHGQDSIHSFSPFFFLIKQRFCYF